MKLTHKRKGFTLIEMLIVVIIIGILASALIPRLSSARGKANDTARKADLQQIATALISYQLDKSAFPSTGTTVDIIKPELTAGGLSSLPRDTSNNSLFSGVSIGLGGTSGYYLYTTIQKNGISDGGFVLMAQTETEGGSNYVVCLGSDIIDRTKNYDNINICNSLSKSTTGYCANNSGSCMYNAGNQLRYIYKY